MWWLMLLATDPPSGPTPMRCEEMKQLVADNGDYATATVIRQRGFCQEELFCAASVGNLPHTQEAVRGNLVDCTAGGTQPLPPVSDPPEAAPGAERGPSFECTALAIRSTTGGGMYAVPGRDASDRIASGTLLPTGWTPVGGGIGANNGAWVVACRPVEQR